jgi:hypothetical protein
VAPDFTYTRPQSDTNVLFVHRQGADGDLYFLDNRNDRYENLSATFRVTGKAAELWHPDTGTTEPGSYYTAGGHTTVPLKLAPWETMLRRLPQTGSSSVTYSAPGGRNLMGNIDGPWQVSFPPDLGAPSAATFDTLTPWNENSDEGIKYFSGTATYTKSIAVPASWIKPGGRIWLDLGGVKNLAQVIVNGKDLGVVWTQPFRFGHDVRAKTWREQAPSESHEWLG